MTTDIDTLATALYVRTDDLLKAFPQVAPDRPRIGIAPQLSDAELVTLAVLQALRGFTSERRWLRQTIESINQTLKGQLDLERHGGHTGNGVAIRVLQRILAMTTAIWHNDKTGVPVHRSLIAYDH